MVDENIPATTDLQVLSPIAWVGLEKERLAKTSLLTGLTPETCLWILQEKVSTVARSLPEKMGLTTDENQRRLEYGLIQTAAVAVLWLESIRRQESDRC